MNPSRRDLLRRSGVLVGLALAGCAERDGAGTATSETGDSNDVTTTVRPSTTVTPSDPDLDWRLAVGESVTHTPTVREGTVYAATTRRESGGGTPTGDVNAARRLAAVDAANGSRRWQTLLRAGARSPPRFRGGTLTLVTGWDGLHGLDYGFEGWSPDGTRLFRAGSRRLKFLSVLGSTGDAAIVASSDDSLGAEGERVRSVSLADGSVRWTVPSGDTAGGAVVGETVYVLEYAGAVSAFDVADGARRWRHELGEYGDPEFRADSRGIFVGRESLLSVDPATGEPRWRTALDTSIRTMTLGRDSVFLAGQTTLQARSRADGSVQWTTEIEGPPTRDPPLHDGTIYVPTGTGSLSAVDAATGEVRWGVDAGGATDALAVAVRGSRLVLVNRDARSVHVYTTEPESLGSFDADAALSPPAVGPDGVYVGTHDGDLLGLSF